MRRRTRRQLEQQARRHMLAFSDWARQRGLPLLEVADFLHLSTGTL
jgi:hypothetical protein